MKMKKYTLNISQIHQGLRLDQYLAQELPKLSGVNLSKSKVRTLIVAGAVYLNGKRVRIASKPMHAGARIEVHLDLKKIQAPPQKVFDLQAKDILYEDDEIVVVNKPEGLPTQPTLDAARDHLYASVKRYLKNRDQVEPYVGLHHRLDFDTSGAVLFTKKRTANKWVSELFKNHKIQKTYHALTVANNEVKNSNWDIKNHLGKSKKTGKVNHVAEVQSGGDFAHTKFRVLERKKNYWVIEAQPLTGRTHQIRVHLQKSKLPILGDVLYSGPRDERIYLHAVCLSFQHGNTKKSLRIEAPYPESFQKRLNRD